MTFDIAAFQQWATGNLVDNRNRGVFAEWMVGQKLGAIKATDLRIEWDAVDLRYGDHAIEVKASGYSQAWNLDRPTRPTFSIAPQKWAWDAATDTPAQLDGRKGKHRRSGWWLEYDPPQRTADCYVFCLHESVPATVRNVADPNEWIFWVVRTSVLNERLGAQKTLGLSRLDKLAESVRWLGLRDAIDDAVSYRLVQ